VLALAAGKRACPHKRDGRRSCRQPVVAGMDKQARPVGILETNNDITERKKVDAELRESERRYRNIFQQPRLHL